MKALRNIQIVACVILAALMAEGGMSLAVAGLLANHHFCTKTACPKGGMDEESRGTASSNHGMLFASAVPV